MRKKEHTRLQGKKKKPVRLHSQITLKIRVPHLLWILIQSHKHHKSDEKLNSRCKVLMWMNAGWEKEGFLLHRKDLHPLGAGGGSSAGGGDG